MNIGGVEKSLLSLLNTIDNTKYNVDLLLLEESGGFIGSIPDYVNVITCNDYSLISEELNRPPLKVIQRNVKNKNIKHAFNLGISYLKTKFFNNYSYYYKSVFKNTHKINKHYDVAIAYSSIIGYLTWFVKYNIDADIYLGWIHFDISKLNFNHNLLLELHKKMDKIFVVSKEALDSFVKEFPELKSKCELRYNIIDAENIKKLANVSVDDIEKVDSIKIMTLGRLSIEKGQDIIPAIAKKLKDRKIDFKWYIIGNGVLKERINREIKSFGLENNVFLLGTKTNP